MNYKKCYIGAALTFFSFTCVVSGNDLALKSSISQHEITWEFDKEVPVGQFVNGDYYVVGEVTVVSIDPQPKDGRNGSVLNQPVNRKAGYDDRIQGSWFDPKQFTQPPIVMKPGDALISTISGGDPETNPRLLRTIEKSKSPVRTAAVLTCLNSQVPDDAFRPGYCDRGTTIYLARNLRRHILPKLDPVGSTPDLDFWIDILGGPWLDTVPFGFVSPYELMPSYGREVAYTASHGSLLLCMDIPDDKKEKILINFVQNGIDLWSIVSAGHPGWPAHGGHGSGRKWFIVLSGILLGDENMQSPYKTLPNVQFGEDMQTMYGEGWTGATALYAGHMGEGGDEVNPGWGPYEHLHPSQWVDRIGEGYRRCCTSISWVGEALAARILHAETIWDHPAFFDYVDRWMEEDDTEFIAIIKEIIGDDYSPKGFRQGQSGYRFIDDMWATYRYNLPEPVKVNEEKQTPEKFRLSYSYPNPFNENTTIGYTLYDESYVKLVIYNISGQLIKVLNNGLKKAGNYTETWNASGLPSGIYFCHFAADNSSNIIKMLLLK
ncbi:MAG: T9SS type A sorting domain-containing protein [Candidatus Latescibacteria bacterium]|nr:T9SS type A sorting domain-containing protein [Candidatus Latescibacterota bacterium]